MSWGPWMVLLAVVLLGTVGQLALKMALQSSGGLSPRRLAGSFHLWTWFLCYVAATILWLVVLRTIPLSQAFPVLGLTFALVPLVSNRLLKEHVAPGQWLGVAVIVTGVALVVQT